MIIWVLLLSCILAVALWVLEKDDLKSKEKKIKNKAFAVLIIVILIEGLQFTTSYIQQSDNSNINDSLGILHRTETLMGVKIDNLLSTQNNDSISREALTKTLDSTNLLIKKSNLIYKNGKLVPEVINSQFNLPNAKFNAPVQQGNHDTQNN